MSNVIKAASITYSQEKRKIDMNSKADEFMRLFVEKHATVVESPEWQERQDSTEGEFVPGIAGLFADRAQENSTEGIAEEAPSEEDAVKITEEAEKRLKEQADQILSDAKEEVKRMLKEAEEEAERRKKEAFEQGQQQGYEEGRQQAASEYERKNRELSEKAEELERSYRQQIEELEPEFISMVITLVKKLTGILLEDKRGIILYLLEQLMSAIEPSNTYLIHVSPEDYDVADAKKTELSWKLKEGAALEMIEDRTLKKGQCIIETDSRIFDCSMDTQLKNLSSDLKLLAGIREDQTE